MMEYALINAVRENSTRNLSAGNSRVIWPGGRGMVRFTVEKTNRGYTVEISSGDYHYLVQCKKIRTGYIRALTAVLDHLNRR